MLDLTRYWYRKPLHFVTIFFLPFSSLFGFCAAIRRWMYSVGMLKTYRFTVPVIVVGNITVGGTGKTPFVIWLAKFLQSKGYRPGIVSRGYGGKKNKKPSRVTTESEAKEVGDEAILLAKNAECPVVICADRAAAVRELLRNSDCNLVIGDDGLQHYRLGRNIEIVVVDGMRRFGNNHLLPAGPLREPVSRLNSADFIIVNGGDNNEYAMTLEPKQLVSLQNQQKTVNLVEFPHKTVHAVAGIGHPERFFMSLKNAGYDVIPHVFPDHHFFQPHDLQFNDSFPIVMTEKDAVKCCQFADERYWYLRVAVKLDDRFQQKLIERLFVHKPLRL